MGARCGAERRNFDPAGSLWTVPVAHDPVQLANAIDPAMTKIVDLVGVGLNATDTLIPVPHYPALGTKVEFHSANILPGGQVATAVVACQQWGLTTRYVG